MKIDKIRLGFATNSSSTHSVIFAGCGGGHTPIQGEYGWDVFLCKTKQEKEEYFATSLFKSIETIKYKKSDENIVKYKLLVKNLFPNIDVEKILHEDCYVDHQSIFCPTINFITGDFDTELYGKIAWDLINDETVHIQGGNDNDGFGGGLPHPNKDIPRFMIENYYLKSVKINDNAWTIFNSINGNKNVLNFGNDEVTFSKTPELIDIKITDFCDLGCAFCYQDSTVHGKTLTDEQFKEIEYFAGKLQSIGVFEVALGGGEPTTEKRLPEIIDIFDNQGIKVNLTTKSKTFYTDNRLMESFKKIGALGISVINSRDVLFYEEKLEGKKLNYTFQYVLDAFPYENYLKILGAKGWKNLLILGYKTVGRAHKNKPYHHPNFLKDFQGGTLSIDTKMALDYEEQIKEANIKPELYYKEEGKFSMYIDLIGKKYGESSYHDCKNFNSIDDLMEKISVEFPFK